MKLKPIVASLALLISGSALAAYAPANSKMERLQAKLDRNQNAYYAQADWFKRICVSGLVQVAAGWSDNNNSFRNIVPLNWASGIPTNVNTFINNSASLLGHPRSVRFRNGKDSSDLFLSRANVYVDADVNDYVEAHLAFDFANSKAASHIAALDDERSWNLSTIQHGQYMTPDEAYITIGNFAKSPLYMRAGREYLRYGHYERNVIPATLVQLLTQTHADAAEIGFVDVSGFNGSAYVFRSQARGETLVPGLGGSAGTVSAFMPKREINNFGAQLGYSWQNGPMGFDFTADFMYDMSAVNMVNFFIGAPADANRESGLHLGLMGHYENFDMAAQFTTALGSYAVTVLNHNGSGARPLAWLVGLGYTMSLMHNNDAHIGVNYQRTQEALAFSMPRYRIQGDFRWEVYKNTELGLALWYDKDYSYGNQAFLDNGTAGVSTHSQVVGSGSTVMGTGNHNFSGLLSLTARVA